jgi:DNA-binding response OmpR family regulator
VLVKTRREEAGRQGNCNGLLLPEPAVTIGYIQLRIRRVLPSQTTVRSNRGMPSSASPQLLVVDDDLRLRALLVSYLESQGFGVEAVGDGHAMFKALEARPIDLIVLDLMLPGEDGLTLCRKLRARGDDPPIIILTARGDDADRIVGLEIGADDYVAKPGNPRELVARIRAVLRRHQRVAVGAPQPAHEPIVVGTFRLEPATRTLARGADSTALTTSEFALLFALASRPHQVMSRAALATQALQRELGPYDRSIDVQISRLRRIVERNPDEPRLLQTVRGSGYVFVPDGEST